ncbi:MULTISPECIES: DNA polymerase [Methylobacterium]|jgi:DNA polymerase I-like protein with 3'-5' exonuclease and polymerase domains|uniref:DNA-directed DNA polymerase n=9 Tax=Pseudomonadota TaxID=1224 RepID=A0ABQ4SZU6_9HYPH|nr:MULTISPECIES: DNA polymerase [Methylobacterium]PIU05266.1 MAG: hypothetical protein COT56_15880 [Methylobacterium sp. CG09_land_8_20_14_0_10_71_15]GBU16832.1 hypothetical protein AwMethylo_10470 [Methylobacterium sp.]GJE08377.1 hypothetical protein AOPFMNJM_3714 [Methylobacterium jeotgali]
MNMHNPVQVEPRTVLVDARNPEVIDEIRALIQSSQFVGFDLETEDSRRHDGLTRFCKYNDEGFKSKTSKTVFDWRRTTICGASFYSEERPDRAYYINFGHSDAENRLPIGLLLDLLKALPAENAHFIAHNSAFEQTVIKAVLDYDFPPGSIICSMTQAVSAYGPDTYSLEAWLAAGQGDIGQLVEGLIRNCHGFDRETGEMSPALSELVFKIIGKSSKASFSWNGFVAAIAYGYGLKQAVRSHFGVQMRTFEDTLDGEAHMGLVTGEQVAAYGADDAYWAVRLFRHLLAYMMRNGGPTLVKTFFEQENVMPAIFSSIAIGGMRVNAPAIRQRTEAERATAAGILREMKAAARNFSWPGELVPELLKRESWYVKNAATYRERVQIWLDASDSDDDYEQALQVRGPVTNAWAAEHGVNEKKLLGVNLSHYMPVRTILYDLLGCKVVVSKGKVASDGEARGRIVDRLKDGKHLSKEQLEQAWAELQAELAVRIEAGGEDALAAGIALEEQQARWTRIQAEEKPSREDLEPFALHHNRYALKVIDCLNRLAGVEQRMKLYLTPYSMLVDPETGRMYPQVTSLLATRRLAASSPNAMQLGKRGEAAYVRGFYVADYDDHLMVSLDWSGVELVEIGEFSGDPEFHKAFGQIPHQDLHAGTATALLSLDCPGMNLELFKSLKGMTSWNEWLSDHHGEADRLPRLMTNLKGELLESAKAYGYWRTVFGKEANFNYFYSGWLATIGERAGWSPQKTADATDAYRAQFPVAEAWRVQQISDVNMLGYVTLPDGHRYTRYEATNSWASEWCDKFLLQTVGAENYNAIVRWIMRKIQKRAGNQTVNALIQGTCATLAKRSIVRTILHFRSLGWGDREFRFLIPIHDELVWSVHQDLAVPFIRDAHRIMVSHDDIFKRCKLDSSPAIGVTFEPWNERKAYGGQIELFEPEAAVVGKERAGKRLDDQGIRDVVEYLKQQRVRMKEAA